MRALCTHCFWHLGDNLVWLHALRKIAAAQPNRAFWHVAPQKYLDQLNAVVEDVPNIGLFSFESDQWRRSKQNSINTWKAHRGYLDQHPERHDWVKFTLDHHNHLARKLGSKVRFTRVEELLFDYPALGSIPQATFFYDFLFVNSEPHSGQFAPMAAHGSGYLDDFIKALAKDFKVITTEPVNGIECTRDAKRTITDIGKLSMFCRNHVMVATGPMWGTLNTTNHHFHHGRSRILLITNGEFLNFPGLQHARSREEAMGLLRKDGQI